MKCGISKEFPCNRRQYPTMVNVVLIQEKYNSKNLESKSKMKKWINNKRVLYHVLDQHYAYSR